MRYLLIISIFIISISNVYSQAKAKEWVLDLGFNAVDDDGKPTSNLFTNLNGLPFPTSFKVEKYLRDDFSLELSQSLNSYQIGKLIDGSQVNRNRFFMSMDLNGKYHLNTLYRKVMKFDPYIAAGLGGTIRGPYTVPTGNVGFGATYWITGQIGVNLQSVAKFSFTGLGSNYVQHMLGVKMNFGK
jgi:hypothetical protein